MNHRTVEDYNFTVEDRLFLDTNVWLYLYAPQETQRHWVNIYSEAFDRILKARSQIYTDVLVLSEFINVYARQEWKLKAAPIRDFKKFRNSRRFKPIARDITADVKRVLGHCSRIKSGSSTLKMDGLLNGYAAGNSDFNDHVITELCKSNELTLITNDSDFKNQTIPVLSANPKLFGK